MGKIAGNDCDHVLALHQKLARGSPVNQYWPCAVPCDRQHSRVVVADFAVHNTAFVGRTIAKAD
jgi:hypothetical protein